VSAAASSDAHAGTYIRGDGRSGADKAAILHKRRKRAMTALLTEFEREIEPLIAAGHQEAIDNFKGVCRAKINGITFEAVGLLRGGTVNDVAVQLAEQHEFPQED
jgi:hypothetical protein